MSEFKILLTNDDGIESSGLWAAAEALSALGEVTVAAPRDQVSSTGRSMPMTFDGIIQSHSVKIHGQEWTAYSVGGTPAQVVEYGILEIMPTRPDLVVSGINYGENIGLCVTISGTVGATLEAASLGIPGLAMSLEIKNFADVINNSAAVDFSTASYFTAYFAKKILEKELPADVDLLKVEVPADATPQTDWKMTRLARHIGYTWTSSRSRNSKNWDQPAGLIGQPLPVKLGDVAEDSDIHALYFDKMVAVTPLSLDMTSRIELLEFEKRLRKSS